MPRLFVAVWPPDDVLDELARLPRPDIQGLRWTGRDQWHVTLRFLGAVPEVEPVADALAGGLHAPTTTARLGPAVDRFGQRILHVPVQGLERLAADVLAATAHLGTRPDDRPFHGHVTLGRVAKQAKADLRRLTGQAIVAEWPVDSVCLVGSQLSPHGSRYEVLRSFQLSGGVEQPA